MIVRRGIRLAAATALLFFPAMSSAGADPLAPYAWDARLLFVFGVEAESAAVRRQRIDIAANDDGFRDRAMIAFVFVGNRLVETRPPQDVMLEAEALRSRFGLPPSGFSLALIGKDTGVALRSTEPVDACTLFALIDGMPMRQSEIAANNGAISCVQELPFAD